jgi:putative transposase
MMKKQHVKLNDEDRAFLEDLTKRKGSTATKMKRALALLALDKGQTYTAVAQTLQITKQSASTWAKKYRQVGLSFLDDQPRAGRPKTITPIEEAKITALACSEPPEGYGRWTLRLLADKAVELQYIEAISYSEVNRILKKTNLSLIKNATGASDVSTACT